MIPDYNGTARDRIFPFQAGSFNTGHRIHNNRKYSPSMHISPASKHSQHKACSLRLIEKNKLWYSKKRNLNRELYQLHLLLANVRSNLWPYIGKSVEETLKNNFQIKISNNWQESIKIKLCIDGLNFIFYVFRRSTMGTLCFQITRTRILHPPDSNFSAKDRFSRAHFPFKTGIVSSCIKP